MNKNSLNDVVVSAGHKNFHMLFTAAEMDKRGRLSQIICGAYPTLFEQILLNSWPLKYSRRLSRFANRSEKLPLNKVSQNRWSEILSSLSEPLSKFGFDKEKISVKAFEIYGKKSEKVIRLAVKNGAKIYHYRAGFGQSSVKLAKKLGMKVICDHSIVHPSLLNPLIDLKGEFPKIRPPRPKGIWGAVLDDIEQADLVVVNSDFVAETFKYMGYDESKIAVVYQGVEDKFFNALPEIRDYYNEESNRPIRFLFAGGIIERKGVDEIAAALEHITSNKIELHLAGSLPEESKKTYSKLLADSRVTYHGMLSQKELAELMSKSDVFLFPSRAEGSARVIFESMASGCAVICTKNSGSIVQDRINGLIIPINDKNSLISSINDVIENPVKFGKFGKSNRELIKKSYIQTSYGDEFEKIYSNILK